MTTISPPKADTANSTRFTAGAKVNCSNGQPCGELTRVIIVKQAKVQPAHENEAVSN